MMEQKIMEYMRRNGMTEAGDHILVACSGGADSVCLLLILHACREQLGISLSAVHVEHGIRGDESREDAAFVRALCARLGIPLMICPVDVPQYALQHRLGTEEAARILRYEQLEQCAGQNGAHTKIAVAHHIEDNVETVLFQMARGSGLAGMAGDRSGAEKRTDLLYPSTAVCKQGGDRAVPCGARAGIPDRPDEQR